MIRQIAIVGFILLILLTLSACQDRPVETEIQQKGWLSGAESDAVRIELLERYLRGFDQPMWEVGDRYEAIYEALGRENFGLAEYHWNKIKTTIQNGYLKRPARRANADALFLDDVWPTVSETFREQDRETAWGAFEIAKKACIDCHIAESVTYMNDQPMFDLTAPTTSEN